MSSLKDIAQKTEGSMRKSVETIAREFNGVRTGRATPALLDSIIVDAYGTPMAIPKVATVSTGGSANVLTVQPWDPSLTPHIEKAILKSDLGITPASDGKVIRLAIPPLTEERRRELAKVVRRIAEEGRVAIRNLRRDANEAVKKLEKDKKISEDEGRRGTEQIQDLTNRLTKEVDGLLAKKEKEIMEF
jgi:ribosome recycling factor